MAKSKKTEMNRSFNQMASQLNKSYVPSEPSNDACRAKYRRTVKYVDFGAGESASLPNNLTSQILSQNGFSISVNYNYQNLNDGNRRAIFSKIEPGIAPGTYVGYELAITDNKIGFYVFFDTFVSSVSIPAQGEGMWHNIVIRTRGCDVKLWDFFADTKREIRTLESNELFDNGIPLCTGTNTGDFLIGDSIHPDSTEYAGKIDDIRIWKDRQLDYCSIKKLGDKIRSLKVINPGQEPDTHQDISLFINFEQNCPNTKDTITGDLLTFLGGSSCVNNIMTH